jgi:hypothetical protein
LLTAALRIWADRRHFDPAKFFDLAKILALLLFDAPSNSDQYFLRVVARATQSYQPTGTKLYSRRAAMLGRLY